MRRSTRTLLLVATAIVAAAAAAHDPSRLAAPFVGSGRIAVAPDPRTAGGAAAHCPPGPYAVELVHAGLETARLVLQRCGSLP